MVKEKIGYEILNIDDQGNKKKKIKKILVENEVRKNKMKLIAAQDGNGDWRYQEQPREEPPTSHLLMVRMNDERKIYWEVIIIVLALYNCLETPIEIAF